MFCIVPADLRKAAPVRQTPLGTIHSFQSLAEARGASVNQSDIVPSAHSRHWNLEIPHAYHEEPVHRNGASVLQLVSLQLVSRRGLK